MAKEKRSSLRSWDDVNQALLEIGQQKVFIGKQEAQLNKDIELLREGCDQKVCEPLKKITALEADIELFCQEHKNEFNSKKKSIKLMHGMVGFRNVKPKVSLLSKKFKWEYAVDGLKKLFGKKYLRSVPEINKTLILENYSCKKISDEKLAEAGLRIEQGENFYYDIYWEEAK